MSFDLISPQKAFLLGAAFSALVAHQIWKRTKSQLPLPPGPKGLPVVGNLFQIPREEPWKVYKEWTKEYGDMIYLEAMGQPILILNSLETIKDLLVSRAENYSDRPDSPLLDLTRARSVSIAVGMNYGQLWREHRREFHRFYNRTQIHRFHPIIEQEVAAFLPRLLDNPNGFRDETHLLIGMIIMRASYGAEDPEYNKKLAHLGEEVVQGFVTYVAPGRLLVSTFHSLRHIPEWFSGAGWKKNVLALGRLNEQCRNRPFDDAEKRVNAGVQSEYVNVAGELIQMLPDKDADEKAYMHQRTVARNVAAQAYVAGVDTTFTTTSVLCLALLMHPEVQRKAQAEIDTVIGPGRLPTISDLENLPYLQAVVKEVTRWHTVVPFSLPHAAAQEDVYKGLKIPAKTLIFSNAWAILHDPEIFEDPMEFRPERYLKDGKIDPGVLDPEEVAFGFGRRICPGRHMSSVTIPLIFASILAFFDVQQAKDKDGHPIPVEYKVLSKLIAVPLPYQCELVPRSDKHVEFLRQL